MWESLPLISIKKANLSIRVVVLYKVNGIKIISFLGFEPLHWSCEASVRRFLPTHQEICWRHHSPRRRQQGRHRAHFSPYHGAADEPAGAQPPPEHHIGPGAKKTSLLRHFQHVQCVSAAGSHGRPGPASLIIESCKYTGEVKPEYSAEKIYYVWGFYMG